ncbi:MAG: hypothetical protein LUG93_00025 [Lachnospiraceae bacterium]|nr:hypothetical protein [Lachnospiraceae bacterium]
MFKKSDFGIVFNTLFSLAFAAALTLFVKYTGGSLTFESFCMGLVPAFAINFTLGSYIPLLKVGNVFAGLFVKDEKHPAFYFLRMLAIVVIMTILMSFLCMFYEMGFNPALPIAFLASLPLTLVYAYVVACIIFPFLLKATQALCAKEG